MRRRLAAVLTALAVSTILALAPGPAGADTFAEFIGRTDQQGSAVTHYGYVTRVRGLPNADLFLDPAVRTEATARLTYFATTTLNARHVVGNIITTATAPGTLTFYERPAGGASFADPASFQVGTPILILTIRYFNVLNVQEANGQGQQVGIATATADAEGGGFQFRVRATGQGTLVVNDPASFVSFFLLGGEILTEP
jgi:hypothetical protein